MKTKGPTEAQLAPIRRYYAADLRYQKNPTEANNVIGANLFDAIPDQPGYDAQGGEYDDEPMHGMFCGCEKCHEAVNDAWAFDRALGEPSWAA